MGENSYSEAFKKMWQHWLIEIGKSETAVAKECGIFQSTLSKSTKTGVTKVNVLLSILDKYGYTIKIVKKD